MGMEIKRQLDVLDRHLADNRYMCGDDYSIVDMAIYPWYGVLAQGGLYDDAHEFIEAHTYKNVLRWAGELAERPAVKRGKLVTRTWGDVQLAERHDASDFDGLV